MFTYDFVKQYSFLSIKYSTIATCCIISYKILWWKKNNISSMWQKQLTVEHRSLLHSQINDTWISICQNCSQVSNKGKIVCLLIENCFFFILFIKHIFTVALTPRAQCSSQQSMPRTQVCLKILSDQETQVILWH